MKMQQERRHNPYPWTWEIPAAITAAMFMIMALATHLGRAIANLAAGGGWQLTGRPELFTSLPRLMSGDAIAGLPNAPAAHASSGQLWFWIAATELAVLVAIALILRTGLRMWGPGRIRGMATPSDAERLLGLARLRRNAAMIRPDLYATKKEAP